MDLTSSRIVIVDDEPMNVRLLERILEAEGYGNIAGTTDPATLFTDLRTPPPDLIMLDLRMGAMDGYAVLDRLRRELAKDDFVPVLVLTADLASDARERALSLGAKDFVTKPFDRKEVLLRVRNLLETRALHVRLESQRDLLEETVQARTADLRRALSTLNIAQQQLKLSQEETIYRLGIAAELRDNDTARHIQRMSRYCGLLAEQMGFDAGRCELIRVASVMHDVGKIGIPDEILLKPGSLSPQERAVMEQHAEIGHQILAGSESPTLKLAAVIALNHHERADGNGYPNRIAGDEIPLEARIAAVADVFDALITKRVYRPAIDLDTALAIMKEGRGTQFDAEILDTFFDSLDRLLVVKSAYDEAGGPPQAVSA